MSHFEGHHWETKTEGYLYQEWKDTVWCSQAFPYHLVCFQLNLQVSNATCTWQIQRLGCHYVVICDHHCLPCTLWLAHNRSSKLSPRCPHGSYLAWCLCECGRVCAIYTRIQSFRVPDPLSLHPVPRSSIPEGIPQPNEVCSWGQESVLRLKCHEGYILASGPSLNCTFSGIDIPLRSQIVPRNRT